MARMPLRGMRSVTSEAGSWKLGLCSSAPLLLRPPAPLCDRLFHIFFRDLAAGSGSGDIAQGNARFGCEFFGQRGCLGGGGKVGQHVALGHAHTRAAGGRDGGLGQVNALFRGQLPRTRRGEDALLRLSGGEWEHGSAGVWGCGSLGVAHAPTLPLSPAPTLPTLPPFPDHRHHRQHRHHLACAEGAALQGAVGRRLDAEVGLVGFDFEQLLSLCDFGAIGDQPFDELDFFDGLPQFGNKDFFGHQLTAFRHAATIRPTFGIAMSSSASARGIGTLSAATRTIGASSQSKARSFTCAITSLMKLLFS